jgi:hypothetical protein
MLVLDRSCLSDRLGPEDRMKRSSEDPRIQDLGRSRDWWHQSLRCFRDGVGSVADQSFRCSCDGGNGRKMATDHRQVREWRSGREHYASGEMSYDRDRRAR